MISSRLRAYSAAVFAAALVLSVYLVMTNPIDDWLPVLALAALNVVVENFAFALPLSGSVSLAFAANFAALLHSGPLAAIVCAIAGSTNLQEFREGKPLVLRMFNVGQLALSAGLAGLAYRTLGGHVVADGGWGIASASLAALAAAVVFFCVNVLLVGYGASLLTGQPFLTTIRGQGFVSYGASLVVLALLGLILANLLAVRSWIGLLLLILPFMAARRTFRVYAELSEAYTSTVRSLVAAIEAKDPYTHGHSERVAVYARRLAESLGVSRSEVDLLERAALLHDVGKIGIDLNTLTSPVQLASEEVREIRRHPSLGSQLVGDVEFLSDIVPIVRHHHERLDGAGYPDGLAGERIPALARMLAVADSYDAMTSTRAYRPGMSEDQAIKELIRVEGTQLDAPFTRRFVSMVRESGGEHA